MSEVTANLRTRGAAKSRKSDRKGIERNDADPYDRGYWARYDGLPRPSEGDPTPPAEVEGWDDCDAELKAERKARREVRRP